MKTFLQTPNSNSCIKSTKNIENKLNPKEESFRENAFCDWGWNQGQSKYSAGPQKKTNVSWGQRFIFEYGVNKFAIDWTVLPIDDIACT